MPESKVNQELKKDFLSPPKIRQFIVQQICWICGQGGWKALSQHLCKKHGLPAAEVREIAYMFKGDRLISVELSKRLSKGALAKFGNRRHIPLKGEKCSNKVLSSKAKDMLKERVKIIRPLASKSQQKRRKSHSCPVCGVIIPTSKPTHCSPQCTHIAWSEAARRSITPERLARFKAIRHIPTPEEQSERAKHNWKIIKNWPIEKQKAYFAKRADARRGPSVSIGCVECGKEFFVPIYRSDTKTCSRECLRLLQSRLSSERPIKNSTRIKLSKLATARWERRRIK